MSYAAAIEHLNALVPELFAAPGRPRRKFSLHEIGLLCTALGEPQKRFPSVLVAGTNGKGSTASTLYSIARESEMRVGLYTSPHLERVNERIRIGGPDTGDRDIEDDAFARNYFRVHDAAQALVLDGTLPILPSYFELLTALAFVCFAEAGVDLAVLEVGMGGRLDATNIVDPLFSVVTDVSLDHQEHLGTTIAAITREKAGILRPGGTLVTLPQHPEANQVLGEVAEELGVRGVNAAEFMPRMRTDPCEAYRLQVLGEEILVDSPLKGLHQHRNLALAIAAAVELAGRNGFPITPMHIELGIRKTRWPGRLERIAGESEPEFLLDVAHNLAGAWALRAALSAEAAEDNAHLAGEVRGQTLIFACLRDKPLREMTQILFPLFDHIVLAPIHSARATDMEVLLAAAEATGVPASPAASVEEAIEIASRITPAQGRVVVSGSLYLVGEARQLLFCARKVQAP